jgi:hypothetical protein
MKHYSPTGRRNHGRPLKRLLDTWERNGSTSGPIPWPIYDDDDDEDYINNDILKPSHFLYPPAYENATERVFRNAGI